MTRFDPLRLSASLADAVPAARPDLRPTIDRLDRRLVASPGLRGTAVAGLVD